MRNTTYSKLDKLQQQLVCSAQDAMEQAYNPYSNFFVGAALLGPENRIITGANFENAAYGSTICAERAAILRANAEGIRAFTKLAIVARHADFDTQEVSAPCGSCRQVLYESSQLAGINLEIILATTQLNKIVVTSINELLPLAFGPRDVGVDIENYT
jgi:cytidine deaminase